jgi:hypothetical protein
MSLNLTFPWNEQAFLNAGEIVFRYKMKYTWKRYIGYAFIAATLYGLLRVVSRGDYSLLYLGVIFTAYWYLLRPILNRQRRKSQFTKEPVQNATMEFVISKGGIRINGHQVPWRDISTVIVHAKGFLLERPQGYPYLPAAAFKSDEDVEALLKRVESNGIKLRRV